MPLYDYQAKDATGRLKSGVVDAPTENSAIESLRDHGLVPFAITERGEQNTFQKSIKFFNRVKPKDLVIFSRQLAVMVSATMPLVQSLRTLVKQTDSDALKIAISEIADEVEGGVKLSVALSKYSNIFSEFYVNMVRSGETSGKLDEILNYLADEQEKSYDLSSKIKGAMIYPVFIVSGLFVVGFIMMTFVLPKLISIIKESGKELPLATPALILMSDFMASYWWLVLILLVGGVIAIRLLTRSGPGRLVWHQVQLRLPVFGNLFQKIYLTRFTQSLSTLLVGGVPLPRSLEIVSNVVGNVVYKDLIQQTLREVEEGRSLSTVFLQSSVVPPMISQMLVVGEKTGRLEEILGRLTKFYVREVENMVGNLVTLIEPIIMLLLGGVVGVMVAAIIMPIYNSLG